LLTMVQLMTLSLSYRIIRHPIIALILLSLLSLTMVHRMHEIKVCLSAKYKYIAFLDSDDEWLPHKIL
jgi:hypothetical protein